MTKHLTDHEPIKPIVSFACGSTYKLIMETHVHAHPVSGKYPSTVYPYLMARAKRGKIDYLYKVVDYVEINPIDETEIKALPPKYNSIKEYIDKRSPKLGFKKAPMPYRFYLLEPYHRFVPTLVVENNNERYWEHTFEELGIPKPNNIPSIKGTGKKSKSEKTIRLIKIPNDEKEQYEHAAKLSLEDLKAVAIKRETTNPERKDVTTKQFKRDPYISELAKRQAKGICQLCGNAAPFVTVDGVPYLETHHIDWLSNGGSDTIKNTVAVCANCHRRLHVLNDPLDVKFLKELKEKQ